MTTRQRAQHIYRRMNSFSNPDYMNDIERDWILDKIEEGIQEYAKDQRGKIKFRHISIEVKIGLVLITIINILFIFLHK